MTPTMVEDTGTPSVLAVGWRGFALIVLFWTLYGGVMFASLFLSGLPQSGAASTSGLLVFALGGAYAWAALTLPLAHLTQRLNLTAQASPWRVLRVLGLLLFGLTFAVIVSMAISFSAHWLLRDSGLLGTGLAGPRGPWEMIRYRVPHDLLACLLVLTAGVARDYFFRYRSRLAEAEVLRTQLVEARLQVLRTQLNPHFLFNTLNAVAAMVQTDPRGVRRMIALLSDLLRQTLQDASEPEVSLERELQTLRRYLEIMEIRFRGRLEARIAADPDVLQALVPQLILQPLVENAMKHGIGPGSELGVLEVAADREGEDLVLSVVDSGCGRRADGRAVRRAHPDGSGGFGLPHTRERLRHLYGDRASLTLTDTDEGGTLAEVRLPFHRDDLSVEGVADAEEPAAQAVPLHVAAR